MESLNEYRALVAVVEAGSIRGAAEVSELPRSTLSRAIQRLEDRLGVRLFERTGKAVEPTEAGRLLYERTRDFLDEIASSEAAVKRLVAQRDRTLVVSMPRTAGNPILVNAITSFAELHPDIDLRLLATDRYVDLEAERVDIAVRPSHVGQPGVLRRKVADLEWGLHAAAGRQATAELPRTVEELWSSRLIVVTTEADEVIWEFDTPMEDSARVVLRTSDFAVALSAAIQGLGIVAMALPPDHAATVRVLPEMFSANIELVAFYRQKDRDREIIHSFVDHFAEQLGVWR